MRRDSPQSDEFIREVDEAVRQDRWLKLWKQYGAYVVGGAIAIVVGTAAGVGWRTWQESERLEEARAFMEARELLTEARPAAAAEAFAALAEDADSGYAVLARLRAAQAFGDAGELDARAAALDELARSDDAAVLYRELGALLKLQQQFAEGDPSALAASVKELSGSDDPWRYSALELQALAELDAGDRDAAREILNSLVDDPTTPANLRQRAVELLASTGGPIEQPLAEVEVQDEATGLEATQ